MKSEDIKSYINVLKSYDEEEYLYSTIAFSTGPTLAREKPSSLLIFNKDNNHNLKDTWERVKEHIKNRISLKFFELNSTEKSTIVLFYNEDMLEDVVKSEKNIKFLSRFNYKKDMNLKQCLNLLKMRFEKSCPHEVGIFLGYPVNDVEMFVNCPNEKCLMVGYWKVYNDIENAKNTFKKYDNIKSHIMKLITKGINPIDIISCSYYSTAYC